ncbi:hypothetical protein DFJ73DRAFT_871492 [Zopfochytrium polystomum]|nr:hypothetical protein DFJ73DRAFT_871492 [Zopfochytrium polystomum]
MKGSTLNLSFAIASTRMTASKLSSIPIEKVWDQSTTGTVTVEHADGSTFEADTPDLHYSGVLDDGSASITATLYDDGIHFVVYNRTSGSLFQVDPVAHIVNAFTPEELVSIAGASHVALVPTAKTLSEPLRRPNNTATRANASEPAGAGSLFRRSDPDVTIPSVGFAPLFDNCFPNILQNHTARIAFQVSYGLFLQLDGAGATAPVKTLAKLGQIVTDMNIIYEHQLRITVQVHTGGTKIMMAPNSTAANYVWNYGPGYCYNTIEDGVMSLSTYVSTLPLDSTVTTYILLSTCSSPNSEVGLAWQPGACDSPYNTAAVQYSSGAWLIVAHEFGHSINASHTFENGQGKTGGIMDYADGRYPIGTGWYGFHPTYNRDEICSYLSIYMGRTCLPLSKNAAGTV